MAERRRLTQAKDDKIRNTTSLVQLLKPFAVMNDRSALSASYKSMELSPEGIRGCAGFGVLEATAGLPIDDSCVVDTATFLAVAKSLPPDAPLEMEATENTLIWAVMDNRGKVAAEGKLALVEVDALPAAGQLGKNPIRLTPYFVDGLDLGGLSAERPSTLTPDMYGVVIDNRHDDLTICSTDDATISVAVVGDALEDLPKMLTLHPKAAALLREIADTINGRASFSERSIVYTDPRYKLMIKPEAALKTDLDPVFDPYFDGEAFVRVDRERIQAFIKRVNAIAENKAELTVDFSLRGGRLALSFNEGDVSSSEYYLVEDSSLPTIQPITLKATTVARALSHVDRMALDHVERGVLVFHGSKPTFRYMVSAHERG